MKLTPVVAALIAATSATPTADTCLSGITVHRFTDSECDDKVEDKAQQKEFVPQKELEKHYDKCYVSFMEDTTEEKKTLDQANDDLVKALTNENDTRVASEDAVRVVEEALIAANKNPYNIANRDYEITVQEEFIDQMQETELEVYYNDMKVPEEKNRETWNQARKTYNDAVNVE